ncbi:ATP-dependent helicase [Lysobacter capsici]|uniref:ATP-binding domain-containing protein n=1 Tax=Lysobacter capsici TaxID=435897 RepID=UPI001F317177
MEALSAHLVDVPLGEHQKALALTFMHGSRRRLDERLSALPVLRNRYECTTLDSFAWRLVRRRRTIIEELGLHFPNPEDYDVLSATAATLLRLQTIGRWVASTFPVFLLDEAQDLTVSRLDMIRALSDHAKLIVAADEFQCLDEALRPNPACVWISKAIGPQELAVSHRTAVPALLNAAQAVRAGQAPVFERTRFVQALTPNAALAGTFTANALGWYGVSDAAIITPSINKFAQDVVAWVQANRTRHNNGPYLIDIEQSERQLVETCLGQITFEGTVSLNVAADAVRLCGDPYIAGEATRWMDRQRRTKDRVELSRVELEDLIRRLFSARRRIRGGAASFARLINVHGAKNREFKNVIVLWPAAVGGTDEQRRRLFYNAITRAKAHCTVLVQAKVSLSKAPFV